MVFYLLYFNLVNNINNKLIKVTTLVDVGNQIPNCVYTFK